MPRLSAPTVVIGYAAFLITLLLGIFVLPGALLQRDMVVLAHPALSVGALGFGDLPARNVPQDGLLALAGFIDASWFVRLLLFGCAIGGVWGATKLTSNPWAQAATITVTLWNPFVVERLLQGHWALVIAAWLVPALIATKGDLRVYWLCTLTPTGAVFGLVIAVLSSVSKMRTFILGLACWLPWLIPSVLAQPTSTATAAFLGRAETYVGTLGAFIGLGGVWNGAAVPASRHAGFALFGVLLFAFLIFRAGRNVSRKWWVLAALATAVFGLLLFDAPRQLFISLPGAALLRDSQKLALLLLPALIVAAATVSKRRCALVIIVLALLQVPDAPLALTALKPISASPDWQRYPGRVLNLDSQGLVVYQDRVLVDPLSKATDVVESGQLVVDGELTDLPSSSYQEAVHYWRKGDIQVLVQLGIGSVIDGGTRVVLSDAPPPPENYGWRFAAGLGLLLYWLALPIAYSFFARHRPVSSQE